MSTTEMNQCIFMELYVARCFRILCAITSCVPLGCVLGSVIFLVCVNGVDYVCCGSNKRQLFVEYAKLCCNFSIDKSSLLLQQSLDALA